MNRDNLDVPPFLQRYSLSERALNSLAYKLEEQTGLEVLRIKRIEDGYVFVGEYEIDLGGIMLDKKTGEYGQLRYYNGAREKIIEMKKRKAALQRRNFKLQKEKEGKRRFIRITAAGIALLISFGIIGHVVAKKPSESVSVESSQVVSDITYLDKANDLVILDWANYAMGQVTDICENSEYDAVNSMKEFIYPDYYVPVMNSYYNYVDYIDQINSGFPAEMINDYKDRSHERFLYNAENFNEYLRSSSLFSQYAFENTLYTHAIILDNNSNRLIRGEDGSLVSEDGNIVTYSDNNYDVYVRADELNFSLNDLPVDAELVDGVVYVKASHLNEQNKSVRK